MFHSCCFKTLCLVYFVLSVLLLVFTTPLFFPLLILIVSLNFIMCFYQLPTRFLFEMGNLILFSSLAWNLKDRFVFTWEDSTCHCSDKSSLLTVPESFRFPFTSLTCFLPPNNLPITRSQVFSFFFLPCWFQNAQNTC